MRFKLSQCLVFFGNKNLERKFVNTSFLASLKIKNKKTQNVAFRSLI